MFVDGSLKATQLDVLRRASRAARREVRLLPASHTPLGVHESTSRSRGLLFAAFGVYAAAAHRCRTLAVPENGLLAVNPPLSPGRVAAASTRSVHPRTLDLLNAAVVGGRRVGHRRQPLPPPHEGRGGAGGARTPGSAPTTSRRPSAAPARRPSGAGGTTTAAGATPAWCAAPACGRPSATTRPGTRPTSPACRSTATAPWTCAPCSAGCARRSRPPTSSPTCRSRPAYAVGDLAAVIGRAREELSAALEALVPAAAGAPVRRG